MRCCGVPLDRPADAELAAALAERRPDALAALYDRYGAACYGLAKRVVLEEELAKDVVQEAFLTVWREAGRYDGSRGSLRAWLLTVTHHRAVDLVRREHRHRSQRAPVESLEVTPSTAAPVEEQVETTVRAARVRQAVEALPAPQREALLLAYFGGYTQSEIARLTGKPLGTVKTRTLAGMRTLRSSLGGRPDDGPDGTGARTTGEEA